MTIHMPVGRDYIDCRSFSVGSLPPFATVWTDEILAAVEDAFGVTGSEVRGRSRKRRVAYARFAAMHLMRKYRPYGLIKIGKCLGKRDHTTVMHGLKRVTQLRATSPSFNLALDKAEAALLSGLKVLPWPPTPEPIGIEREAE